jgi:hypothetical protein
MFFEAMHLQRLPGWGAGDVLATLDAGGGMNAACLDKGPPERRASC